MPDGAGEKDDVLDCNDARGADQGNARPLEQAGRQAPHARGPGRKSASESGVASVVSGVSLRELVRVGRGQVQPIDGLELRDLL